MAPSRPRLLSLGLLFLLLVGGCAAKDPHGRLPISGNVTLAGAPLDQGMIQFLSPDANQKAPLTGAMIRVGKYEVPREQGLAPGSYRVVISAPEAKTPTNPTGPPDMKAAPIARERIPPAYNRDTKQTIEVKEGAPASSTSPFPSMRSVMRDAVPSP